VVREGYLFCKSLYRSLSRSLSRSLYRSLSTRDAGREEAVLWFVTDISSVCLGIFLFYRSLSKGDGRREGTVLRFVTDTSFNGLFCLSLYRSLYRSLLYVRWQTRGDTSGVRDRYLT